MSCTHGPSTGDADRARTDDLLRDRQPITGMDKGVAVLSTGYYGLRNAQNRPTMYTPGAVMRAYQSVTLVGPDELEAPNRDYSALAQLCPGVE